MTHTLPHGTTCHTPADVHNPHPGHYTAVVRGVAWAQYAMVYSTPANAAWAGYLAADPTLAAHTHHPAGGCTVYRASNPRALAAAMYPGIGHSSNEPALAGTYADRVAIRAWAEAHANAATPPGGECGDTKALHRAYMQRAAHQRRAARTPATPAAAGPHPAIAGVRG